MNLIECNFVSTVTGSGPVAAVVCGGAVAERGLASGRADPVGVARL
jgi:hypothetical protein